MKVKHSSSQSGFINIIIAVVFVIVVIAVTTYMYSQEDDGVDIVGCDQEVICSDEQATCESMCWPDQFQDACIGDCRRAYDACMAQICNTAEDALTLVDDSGAGEITDLWTEHSICNRKRATCRQSCDDAQASVTLPNPTDPDSWDEFQRVLAEGQSCYYACDVKYGECEAKHGHEFDAGSPPNSVRVLPRVYVQPTPRDIE